MLILFVIITCLFFLQSLEVLVRIGFIALPQPEFTNLSTDFVDGRFLPVGPRMNVASMARLAAEPITG